MDPSELWALGEYAAVAERLQPAAEALVEAAGVEAGHRVLDAAAGTGNVADAALHRGAHVVAVDLTPAMLEAGRRRLPDLEWIEADVQDLPFEDATFDRVLSAFGAMFAPDPVRTAEELLRVTRPGGAVAMTSWAPGRLTDLAGEVLAEALGDGPDGPAERWQDPQRAKEHFAGADEVTVQTRTLSWPFESPEAWLAFLSEKAPPFVAARAAIGEDRWPGVAARIADAVREEGTTPDGVFLEEPPYLLIVARRR